MTREPEKDRPPRPMVQLKTDSVRAQASPVRCPYCHADLVLEKPDWVACRECLARHHVACWNETASCANCRSESVLVASPAPARGRRSAALGAVVAALLAFPLALVLVSERSTPRHEPPPRVEALPQDEPAPRREEVKRPEAPPRVETPPRIEAPPRIEPPPRPVTPVPREIAPPLVFSGDLRPTFEVRNRFERVQRNATQRRFPRMYRQELEETMTAVQLRLLALGITRQEVALDSSGAIVVALPRDIPAATRAALRSTLEVWGRASLEILPPDPPLGEQRSSTEGIHHVASIERDPRRAPLESNPDRLHLNGLGGSFFDSPRPGASEHELELPVAEWGRKDWDSFAARHEGSKVALILDDSIATTWYFGPSSTAVLHLRRDDKPLTPEELKAYSETLAVPRSTYSFPVDVVDSETQAQKK